MAEACQSGPAFTILSGVSYGLVSALPALVGIGLAALIGRQTGDALDIELWIMSFRTFKRNLEYALFDRLVDVCRERGIKTINGIYLPTAKNL